MQLRSMRAGNLSDIFLILLNYLNYYFPILCPDCYGASLEKGFLNVCYIYKLFGLRDVHFYLDTSSLFGVWRSNDLLCCGFPSRADEMRRLFIVAMETETRLISSLVFCGALRGNEDRRVILSHSPLVFL